MSSDLLNPALISPVFWPEVRRGTERFARELADALRWLGHSPCLITSHAGRPTKSIEDGLPVVRSWRPPAVASLLRWRRFEDYLDHAPLAYIALRRGSYDLAHALHPTGAAAAVRWSERTGRPSVLSYMGMIHRGTLQAARLRLELTVSALERCSSVVALSHAAARSFERWLGYEVRVIHPGVDLDTFEPGGTRAEHPTILCAAAIGTDWKRVDMLVRAFQRLRRQRPSAVLLLSRPASAQQLPDFLDGVEGVELVDLDDRKALAAAYRRSWVTTLPSIGEAFGLVLVESLACGTPVVGSVHGAIPEIIDRPEIGRTFLPDTEEGLATALLESLELAHDPAAAGACRARAEQFSMDRCAREYLSLYQELLGTRR
jgi:glycosyltransferase involved in cell wall biosynthesis